VSGGYLRRLPIRAKLVAMLMITSATVLVLAGVGYLTWDYYRLRADLASELGAQANLVLENSSAALSFQNQRDATESMCEAIRFHEPSFRTSVGSADLWRCLRS